MLSYLVVGKEQKKASDWVRLLNSGRTGWQTLQVSMKQLLQDRTNLCWRIRSFPRKTGLCLWSRSTW